MKKIPLLFFMIIVAVSAQSQSSPPTQYQTSDSEQRGTADVSVNVQNNFGYTIVSVSEAIGIPEPAPGTNDGLVEWDQFHYKGLLQLFFDAAQPVSFGPEIGVNRLYHWQEIHTPRGLSPRWRWGTIWTGHIGGLVRWQPGAYYLATGASLHFFFNGSGATLGLPIAVGHEVRLAEAFTLPIEFRMDVVFGDAVPIGLGGGVGFKIHFGK